MAYSPAVRVMFLFGGFAIPSATLSSATWMLTGSSLQTLGWTQVTAGQPPARWGAALGYDSTDRYLVLFGGCSSLPVPNNLSICTSLLGDTWTLSTSWSNLGVISGGPPARFGASVAAGPVGTGMFIVDGFTVSGPVSDEWQFSNHVWSRQALTLPTPARWGAEMDYDALDGIFVIFGGFGLNSSRGPIAFNDTWFEFPGANWNAAGNPAFTYPPQGFGSMVFDPDAGGNGWNLQFGGSNAADWRVFGSTWYFMGACGWVDITPWT